jgi:hypothetical protein
MNQALQRLVERRIITRETAFNATSNKDELITMLERGSAAVHPATMAARKVPVGQGAAR